MSRKRVQFDVELEATHGGGLQGQDFRLDIDGDDIDARALADPLVADLRLLMVGPVRILNKQVIAEPHKRDRPRPSSRLRGIVELSHVVADGTVTYPGLPAPRICDYLSREASRAKYAPSTSSRSHGSTWSPTPAPTSTARSIVSPRARISPR